MQIYLSALQLPDVEPDTKNASSDISPMAFAKFGKLDVYWEVYNPYEREDPVAGSLTDDICSVRDDLRRGCHAYEVGFKNDALWQWRFDFRSHWGFHAVDAIRAINQIVLCGP